MSNPAAPDFRPRPAARGNAAIAVIAVVAAVAAAAALGGMWWSNRADLSAAAREQGEVMLRITGLGRPVTNRLDARYADADGDLVADPPAGDAAAADPPTLRFSYVAVADPEPLRAAMADLIVRLSEAANRPVEFVPVTDADAQLLALRDGELHVTAFNTGGVPVAVNAAGFVPVSTLADAEGRWGYRMEIIVPAAGPIGSVADLRGRELTLTDPTSNSGFKAPLVLLRGDAGLAPGRDFAVRYSGGQDQSIAGIAGGQYEAAAVASDVLARAVEQGAIKKDAYRSVFSSERFPPAAFGYAHDLSPALAAKVRGVLADYAFEGDAAAFFVGAGQSKLVPIAYKDAFALVRRVDDQIGYAHVLRPPAPPEEELPDAESSPTTAPAAEPVTAAE